MQWVNDEGDLPSGSARRMKSLTPARPHLAQKPLSPSPTSIPKVKSWIKLPGRWQLHWQHGLHGDLRPAPGLLPRTPPSRRAAAPSLLPRQRGGARPGRALPGHARGAGFPGPPPSGPSARGAVPPASFHMDTFEGRAGTFTIFGWPRSRSTSRTKRWWRRQRARASTNLATSRATRAHAQQSPRGRRPSLRGQAAPAHNIDILRCCVTFEDVASMRKGIEGLVALARKGCGGVGRVKNGFALSDAEAAKSFHYRSWMMNMVVDFGQTFEC